MKAHRVVPNVIVLASALGALACSSAASEDEPVASTAQRLEVARDGIAEDGVARDGLGSIRRLDPTIFETYFCPSDTLYLAPEDWSGADPGLGAPENVRLFVLRREEGTGVYDVVAVDVARDVALKRLRVPGSAFTCFVAHYASGYSEAVRVTYFQSQRMTARGNTLGTSETVVRSLCTAYIEVHGNCVGGNVVGLAARPDACNVTFTPASHFACMASRGDLDVVTVIQP